MEKLLNLSTLQELIFGQISLESQFLYTNSARLSVAPKLVKIYFKLHGVRVYHEIGLKTTFKLEISYENTYFKLHGGACIP